MEQPVELGQVHQMEQGSLLLLSFCWLKVLLQGLLPPKACVAVAVQLMLVAQVRLEPVLAAGPVLAAEPALALAQGQAEIQAWYRCLSAFADLVHQVSA
jgi:hypothetical protein